VTDSDKPEVNSFHTHCRHRPACRLGYQSNNG